MRHVPALAAALAGTLALVCACGPSAGPAAPGDGPRAAILITLDTTQFFAVGFNGGPAGLTPNLDALARESVVYRWARTVAPVTLPAHASMLTGLYPHRHGVRDNGLWPLPASAETVAERARAAGFETAAFVAAAVLDRSFGLDQGFQVYEQPRAPGASRTVHYAERPAREVVRGALAWLRERRDAPLFLWVHLFDPHQPYEPSPRFLAAASGDPYLGEVAELDHALGELFDELRALGLMERAFLAIVADHGEGRGMHGEATHANFVYDTTMRVPFLLRHPDGRRAGETSAEVVSVVDVAPTLLEALGLPPDADADGTSLYRASVPEDRGVYFESMYGWLHYGWSPLAGWATRHGKYVHSSEPELYRPLLDPGERQDLAATSDLEPWRATMAEVLARPALPRDEASGEQGGLDPALLERIEALGYAVGGAGGLVFPDPLAPSDGPAPRTRLEELERINQAVTAAETGDHERAVELLRAIVAENPRNSSALEYLSFSLIELQRWDEAREALLRTLALGIERASLYLNLANSLYAAGDLDGAERNLRRALELQPDNDRALENLVALLEQQGRADETADLRARLAEVRAR